MSVFRDDLSVHKVHRYPLKLPRRRIYDCEDVGLFWVLQDRGHCVVSPRELVLKGRPGGYITLYM